MTRPDAIPFRAPRPGTRLPILVDTTTDLEIARLVATFPLHVKRQVLAIVESVADAEHKGLTITGLNIVTLEAVDEAKV